MVNRIGIINHKEGNMKKLLYLISIVLLVFGCAKDEPSYYIEELAVDTANCIAEGSYVQGAALGDYCTVRMPYSKAAGGTAVISAPETNGMRIDEQTVQMAEGDGEAVVKVSGTPLRLETSFLQLNVKYKGQTYMSSVEIVVLEDVDPSGTVTFTIDETPVSGLVSAREIVFTVDPTMAAVVAVAPEGLRAAVESDPAAGTGKVILTPGADFLSGEVVLTATFGARPVVERRIKVSAFHDGDGTASSPYVISDANGLEKLAFGADKAFRLDADIAVGDNWALPGTVDVPFNGILDGNGKTITLDLNRPDNDNVALFAHIGPDADIRNLVLAGSVTGRDNVAALAAASAKAFDGVDVSSVAVKGGNHVAASVASGDGKDDAVIVFGTVPAAVNILMGAESATGKLGVEANQGVSVEFNAGDTGTKWAYDSATGDYTVTKDAGFVGGDITFFARIGDKVTSTVHTLTVSSKKMYESGTGTEADPYVVAEADQFTATLHTYPAAHVKLDGDIVLSGWETIADFSGSLDGNGHIVEGLDAPFAGALTGAVSNVRFRNVNITAGTSACGAVANLLGGRVEGVAVTGVLSAPKGASSGDTGFGSVAGQAQGASVIDNCYVNVTMTTNSNFATGGLVGVIKGTNNVTMSNSTVEGSISGTVSGTRLGGILGRKTNTNQSSKDIITGCLVTAEVKMTGEGSNMIGGVFGALQGATVAGDYVGGITIKNTAFTGSVSGGNAIGGIGGVCCSVYDCYVGGSVQATNVSSNSTAAAAGVSAAAKGDVVRCIVAGARVTGGPKGSSFTAGIVNARNGNKPMVSNCAVLNTSVQEGGFAIYGTANADVVASGNYRWNITYSSNDAPYTPVAGDDTYGQDGVEQEPSQAFFESLGYDFANVWEWDPEKSAPKLKKVGCEDSVKVK